MGTHFDGRNEVRGGGFSRCRGNSSRGLVHVSILALDRFDLDNLRDLRLSQAEIEAATSERCPERQRPQGLGQKIHFVRFLRLSDRPPIILVFVDGRAFDLVGSPSDFASNFGLRCRRRICGGSRAVTGAFPGRKPGQLGAPRAQIRARHSLYRFLHIPFQAGNFPIPLAGRHKVVQSHRQVFVSRVTQWVAVLFGWVQKTTRTFLIPQSDSLPLHKSGKRKMGKRENVKGKKTTCGVRRK